MCPLCLSGWLPSVQLGEGLQHLWRFAIIVALAVLNCKKRYPLHFKSILRPGEITSSCLFAPWWYLIFVSRYSRGLSITHYFSPILSSDFLLSRVFIVMGIPDSQFTFFNPSVLDPYGCKSSTWGHQSSPACKQRPCCRAAYHCGEQCQRRRWQVHLQCQFGDRTFCSTQACWVAWPGFCLIVKSCTPEALALSPEPQRPHIVESCTQRLGPSIWKAFTSRLRNTVSRSCC